MEWKKPPTKQKFSFPFFFKIIIIIIIIIIICLLRWKIVWFVPPPPPLFSSWLRHCCIARTWSYYCLRSFTVGVFTGTLILWVSDNAFPFTCFLAHQKWVSFFIPFADWPRRILFPSSSDWNRQKTWFNTNSTKSDNNVMNEPDSNFIR
jgi:hypothetical protein